MYLYAHCVRELKIVVYIVNIYLHTFQRYCNGDCVWKTSETNAQWLKKIMKWVKCELYKTLTKQHIIDKLSAYGVSLSFFHCAFVSLIQLYCDISFSSISKTNSADIYCSLKLNGAVSRPSHGCGTVGRRVSPLHFEPEASEYTHSNWPALLASVCHYFFPVFTSLAFTF